MTITNTDLPFSYLPLPSLSLVHTFYSSIATISHLHDNGGLDSFLLPDLSSYNEQDQEDVEGTYMHVFSLHTVDDKMCCGCI